MIGRRKAAFFGFGLALVLLAAPTSRATDFNPELWEFTGLPENPTPRNVYDCTLCTFEQFLAVPNWDRNTSEGNARIFLPDEGTNVPPIPDSGTALSLDLVPEIEGDVTS